MQHLRHSRRVTSNINTYALTWTRKYTCIQISSTLPQKCRRCRIILQHVRHSGRKMTTFDARLCKHFCIHIQRQYRHTNITSVFLQKVANSALVCKIYDILEEIPINILLRCVICTLSIYTIMIRLPIIINSYPHNV